MVVGTRQVYFGVLLLDSRFVLLMVLWCYGLHLWIFLVLIYLQVKTKNKKRRDVKKTFFNRHLNNHRLDIDQHYFVKKKKAYKCSQQHKVYIEYTIQNVLIICPILALYDDGFPDDQIYVDCHTWKVLKLHDYCDGQLSTFNENKKLLKFHFEHTTNNGKRKIKSKRTERKRMEYVNLLFKLKER